MFRSDRHETTRREAQVTALYEAQMRAALRQSRHERAWAMARDGWPLAMGLLAFLAALALASDCGNLREAHADPVPEAAPVVLPAPTRPDPRVEALAAAALAWQPTAHDRADTVRQLAADATRECDAQHGAGFGEACARVVVCLAYRESSWRTDAIGALGERGLLQVHGAALGGESRDAAMDPTTNVRLGVAWLAHCWMLARLGNGATPERILSLYGGERGRPSRGARLVLRWAETLRAAGTIGGAS